jgi:nicotinamidase-related amidase
MEFTMNKSLLEQLSPTNCQVIFIDHQPQMAFGVQSIDRQVLKNNTVGLAKAAKTFNIPVTITTVETESFSGHTLSRTFRCISRCSITRTYFNEFVG